MTKTQTLIEQILNSPATTSNRDRDIVIPQCDINSITKELNNSRTQELNNPYPHERDEVGIPETSSSFGESKEKSKGFRDKISGIEIQLKPAQGVRQHAYITLQTHEQLAIQEAMNFTAYLVSRERGRDFKRLSAHDQEIYKLTLRHRNWWIGHISERGTKRLLSGVVITLDPELEQMTFWFSDHSAPICASTNNKLLTASQQRYFSTAGFWGTTIQLPGRETRNFLDCETRVGGRA